MKADKFRLGWGCAVVAVLSLVAATARGDEWDDAMAVPGTVAAVPEHLWFPYVSTYYVKPIVTTAETLRVGYYVTDWNQSEVRAALGIASANFFTARYLTPLAKSGYIAVAGGEKNRYLPGKQYRILRKGKAVVCA